MEHNSSSLIMKLERCSLMYNNNGEELDFTLRVNHTQ